MRRKLPWEENRPIAASRKELYKPFPRPGSAAAVVVHYVGPRLERMEIHARESRVDVPEDTAMRLSEDNGRTWSEFIPLPPTLSYPRGVEVWEGSGPQLYDPVAGLLVDGWLRQIALGAPLPTSPPPGAPQGPGMPAGAWTRQNVYCTGRRFNCFTYYRLSWDHGLTWTSPRQLRYEDGEDFDPSDPLKAAFLQRNQAYFGTNFVRHSSGTLIHCAANANAPGDPHNGERAWRMGSLCFIGRWDPLARDYHWTPGGRVEISPDISADGLQEPAVAELGDGRVLIIWRGTSTPATPGRKWFSVSRDGGITLSDVRELTYDDGSRFYSPSSIHALLRHSVTRKLYWVGNISAVPPRGNWPRYPLVIAEVDEAIPALKRRTVTVIDNRSPPQSEYVEFSNFSLLEDRESHRLELYLTAYGENLDHINSANCYKYTVELA